MPTSELRSRLRTAAFGWLSVLLPALASAAEPPAALLFSQRCAACHSIGEGPRVGPDLLGVMERRERDWLEKFIRAPGALIDAGDPVALELLKAANGVRMPDQALTPAELDGLFTWFTACSAKGGCKPGASGPKLASDATPDDLALGLALFEGATPLENGGPPCIGCHDARGAGIAGGGTLGGDLTFTYAHIGGERRLKPVLAEMKTPVMASLYSTRPLTEGEQYATRAYLWSLSRDGAKHRPDREFVYLGIAGLAATLGFIGLVWGGRARRRDDEESKS